jgi:homoserine kinase
MKNTITKKKKTSLPAALYLALPATTANLGPAFDAAALAMNLFIKIDARPSAAFAIKATGRDSAVCGKLENHLILTTYREVLQRAGVVPLPLSLLIRNDIPIGKGCGSSAAARLAGIALASHFGKLRWKDSEIIAEASRREHHSDNVSACWMGGLTVARMSGETGAQLVCLEPKGKWPLLLAVPDQVLPTEQARRVLPAQYSRAASVANIQNSMLLLAAFLQGRHDLLASALEDHIHQPYRAPLCPLLPSLQQLTGKPGVLGVALSGAGPSVVVFLDPKVPSRPTLKAVSAHLASAKLHADLILTSIASGAVLRIAKSRSE